MTRPQMLSQPNVLDNPVVLATNLSRRHIFIKPMGETFSLQSVAGGGSAAHTIGTPVAVGGGGSLYKALNYGSAGAWMEWHLGILESTRPWDVLVTVRPGPDRGILTVKMDGTSLGTLDAYSTGYAAFTGTFVWTPTTNDQWVNHKLRLEVTGKNAAASNYGMSIHALFLDRQAGANTITPGAPS